MKKSIFILVLILVGASFSNPCASQVDVVLGLLKTSIIGSESWQDPIGLQVGAIVPVANINDMLSFRAEANLSMQGAKWAAADWAVKRFLSGLAGRDAVRTYLQRPPQGEGEQVERPVWRHL